MPRVVIISDTHRRHWDVDLPKGDVLLHCGDFTGTGLDKEIIDFNSWLAQQDFSHKVVTPGNHELTFESDWERCAELLPAADYILKDSGCTLRGPSLPADSGPAWSLRIWGSPWTPEFHGWAFNYGKREGELRWDQIPEGLDILMTHGPPHMILDRVSHPDTDGNDRVGCPGLLKAVMEKKPKLHCFGHIHESPGDATVNGIRFINAAQLTLRYEQEDRKPWVVDL